MSSLFQTGTQTKQTMPATALRVQSSVQGMPIPILYGQARVSGNLIWYGDFVAQSVPNSSGKGSVGAAGKGSNSGNSYLYAVSFIMGICEGTANYVQAWKNTTPITLANLNLGAFPGSTSQTAWPYMTTLHPTQALAYRGLSYVAAGPQYLGNTPQLPNMNFEVLSGVNSTDSTYPGLSSQTDADPAAVITDYLTNLFYGAGFPSSYLGSLVNYADYCLATGLMISTAETQQRAASDFIKEILQGTNSDCFWSSGQLQITPYGDQAIVAGTVYSISEQHTVPQGDLQSGGNFAKITVGCPGNYVSNVSVINVATGLPLTNVSPANPTVANEYTLIGNTYHFSALPNTNVSSGMVGVLVQINYTYSAAASYSPPAAPEYDLTDDDILSSQNSDAPIDVTRVRVSDQFNDIKVEYLDRSNDYNPVVVEIKDDAAIAMYGPRPMQTVSMHYFALGGAANVSASLILGRQNIRTTFVFTVAAKYILLDPMDIVSITDFNLGLFRQWVRIKEIQENDDKTLTITAEIYLYGTGNAPLYGKEAPQGPALNYNISPGNVNAPIIFEPPYQLSQGMEVWLAVSGQTLQNWGGCNVYLSYDNVTYVEVEGPQIVGPARMGVLTSSFPVGTNPDDTHTLSVDLSESGGQLTSGSAADETALNTLCYVDGEFVAYRTATPTAANAYNLTHFQRGAYGSTIAFHSPGSNFARIDKNIFVVPYDQTRIANQIYLKFCSFNIYGQMLQSLADVNPYTYTISGLLQGQTTVQGFSAVGVTVTAANGGKIPGIQVSWTPITNASVTQVIVEYWTDGQAANKTQAFFSNPASGTGLITAGIQPNTLYDLHASFSVSPSLLPTTFTSIIQATSPNTLVLISPTDGPAPNVPTSLALASTALVNASGDIICGFSASWDVSPSGNFSYFDFEYQVGAGPFIGNATSINNFSKTGFVVGTIITAKVRAVSKLGVISAFSAPISVTITGQASAPNAPNSLVVTGGFQLVGLKWNNPTNPDFDYVEIWRGQSTLFAFATLVATFSGNSWVDKNLANASSYWYWIRAVNTSGLQSAFTPSNAGAGALANTLKIDGGVDIVARSILATDIQTGTLTANEIQGGTITANLMHADSITATNAALQDLTVSTIKIQGQAVTQPSTVSFNVTNATPGVHALTPTGGSQFNLTIDTTLLNGIAVPFFVVASAILTNPPINFNTGFVLNVNGVDVQNVGGAFASETCTLVWAGTITGTGGNVNVPITLSGGVSAAGGNFIGAVVAQAAKR